MGAWLDRLLPDLYLLLIASAIGEFAEYFCSRWQHRSPLPDQGAHQGPLCRAPEERELDEEQKPLAALTERGATVLLDLVGARPTAEPLELAGVRRTLAALDYPRDASRWWS